jgi:hypothetical protein
MREKIAFAWLSRFYMDQFRNLPEYFRFPRAIQICILRLFARRILAREDMFSKGVAENSAEE